MSGRNVELEKKKEHMRAMQKEKASGKQPSSAIDKALSITERSDERGVSPIDVVQSKRKSRSIVNLSGEGVVSKCLIIGEDESTFQMPYPGMAKASSSISLGHQVASLLFLPGDQDKRDLPLSASHEQALAHATQTVIWIASQAKESTQAEEDRLQFERDLEFERKLRIKSKKELADSRSIFAAEKDDLQKAISEANSTVEDLQREVARAKASEQDAQDFWYSEGLKDRLVKVRAKVGAKYTDFFFPGEVDPIKDIPLEDGDES